MCQYYTGKMPSEMLGITCKYTAYCLNEAVAYIISKLNSGEKPVKKIKKENKESKCNLHLSSFSKLYEKYE